MAQITILNLVNAYIIHTEELGSFKIGSFRQAAMIHKSDCGRMIRLGGLACLEFSPTQSNLTWARDWGFAGYRTFVVWVLSLRQNMQLQHLSTQACGEILLSTTSIPTSNVRRVWKETTLHIPFWQSGLLTGLAARWWSQYRRCDVAVCYHCEYLGPATDTDFTALVLFPVAPARSSIGTVFPVLNLGKH